MRSIHNSLVQVSLFVAGLVLITILLGWGNYSYAAKNPGGNDFLPRWVGARAFMIEGTSPYSDEVASRIQIMAYGHPATEGEDEMRVAYPLYSFLVFAPFALIRDFVLARALWMTFLEICVAMLIVISIRVTKWRPSFLILLLFFLFGFTWYHTVRPLILGNAVIVVSLGLVGALLAIKTGKDELAGILLGLTTIKPQVVVLLIGFVVFWGISKKRLLLVGWTLGTIAALTIGATIFLPDWIIQNLREVIRYPSYNPPGTLGAVLDYWWPAFGKQIGIGISITLIIFLLIEWLGSAGKEYRHFLWTFCLTLTFSQWIGIQTDPGNFIVLFLPVTLIFARWQERWGRSSHFLILTSQILLTVGIWWLFLTTFKPGSQPIQHPVMFLPLPMFLLFGLYWIRWSAIKQLDLWADKMRQREQY